MPANPKRLTYRLLFWARLLLAFGVLALFLRVYVSPLMRWIDIRAALTSLQLTGALMQGGVFAVAAAAILIVAAIAGRWYCSILCPFGTLQEGVWRAGRMVAGRARFISPWRLRYIVPALTGIGIIFALPLLFLTMDPISNFGRGVRSVHILASEGAASVTPVMWAMLGMFAFVLTLAVARGRRFCDWCPVGVLLGAFASVAPLGMRLKKDACVSCGKCERFCPMNCIDSKGKSLDDDRCILCLSCASACAVGALGYGTVSYVEKAERRSFLRKSGNALAWLAGLIYLGGTKVLQQFPRGVRYGTESHIAAGAARVPFIMPPGAQDTDWLLANCIGCQACAAACPTQIIRFDDGPHPRLDFTGGYCQYNCTECADVCPTNALHLPYSKKQRTRIALATLHLVRCVVLARREACGACAEVCAPRALRMEPLGDDGLTMPVFDDTYCIGCGGCYYICPVEPKAFTIVPVTPQALTPGMRPTDGDAAEGVFVAGDEFPF